MTPALGGESLDISINCGDWSDGGSGGNGGGWSFSGSNLLGAVIPLESFLGLS